MVYTPYEEAFKDTNVVIYEYLQNYSHAKVTAKVSFTHVHHIHVL